MLSRPYTPASHAFSLMMPEEANFAEWGEPSCHLGSRGDRAE